MKHIKTMILCFYMMVISLVFLTTADADWKWQNPLPQGNTLNDVWCNSDSDVFAVGDNGTILHYDGLKWSAMSSGTTFDLNGVWGSSGSDVFAVGGHILYGEKIILHYDGSVWAEMNPGTTTYSLYGVWGSSNADVFAVGGQGKILHYDGNSWSEMSSGTTNILYGVWGSSDTDVFAVASQHIFHYDGSTWSSTVFYDSDFHYIWGSSGSDVFALDSDKIFHYDGSEWSEMTSGTTEALKKVWGNSGSDVFAVGWSGTILHYDGSSWSEMTTGIYNSLFGVWGNSGSDVFAVGVAGQTLHYNGSLWSVMSSGLYDYLNDIWGSSSSDIFAVGLYGSILHYNGSMLYKMNSGTLEHLHGVWGNSAHDVFAVGEDFTILHYDGNTWSKMNSGKPVSGDWDLLLGVWGSSGSDVFAVGFDGTILHYDGNVWSKMVSGTTANFRGVWGSSGIDVFAIGGDPYYNLGGKIYHYDGSVWSEMNSGTEYALDGIWGSSGSDVFVVGYHENMSIILHYDGSVWSEFLPSGHIWGLYGVWGSSDSNVFAVGYPGTIVHYNGSVWSEMTSLSNASLEGVWGSSGSNVYAVGEAGTILHYGLPEINLKQGYTIITNDGNYNFGGKRKNTATDIIFTITNNGNDDLNLTIPFTISGTDADQFSIVSDPASIVKPGNTTTFTVRFTPTSVGPKIATIGITNDDPDESPYNFTVTGTGSQKATMITPTPYTTLADTTATFTWNDFYADQYWLQVGRSLGGGDIYSADQGNEVSVEVNNLPYKGETLFVRLWSKIDGQWLYNDYTYTAYDYSSVWSVITSPTPGSELVSRDVTFEWSNAGADQYWLQVGTTVGEDDLYSADQGTGASTLVTGLPHGGETIYVRLWQKAFGEWFHADYTYTAFNDSTAISNWIDGSVLDDDTVTFNWNDSGAAQYWLWVGTTPGGKDLYNADQGTALSAQIGNLPHNGETVYVRLYSLQDGDWIYRDYTYTAVNDAAEITSPVNGSVFSSTEVTFSWDGLGATQYWLWVGTSLSAKNIYDADQATNTSATVSGLPYEGQRLYVRLWSKVDGNWIYNDYQYRAYDTTHSLAVISDPESGSKLASRTEEFTWNNSGADQYWLYIGLSLGASDLYSGDQGTNTSATVSNLPFNGETIHVRLWQKEYGKWYYTDHNYTACDLAAVIDSPINDSTLGSTSAIFEWNDAGADQYWLYVGTALGAKNIYSGDQGTNFSASVSGLPYNGETVYVRLWSHIYGQWIFNDYTYTAMNLAAAITSPTDGSTFTTTEAAFTWDDVAASQYWLWVGSTVGEDDIYSADQGTQIATTVIGLPHNSETLYVRLWSKKNGEWLYNDHTYIACNDGATIATPVPGTLNDTTAAFTWVDVDADHYWLVISTTLGGNNIYTADQGRNLSVVVSGLPHNSETLYVRLWSKMNGEWVYNDHTYTACNDGAIINSPTPDSTLISSTVTFEWSNASADQYWLYIGSALGADDLFSADQGTSLSVEVFALPCDGETLWVRLYSKMSGDWVWNDHSYTACDF